jgi:hypothetical protein
VTELALSGEKTDVREQHQAVTSMVSGINSKHATLATKDNGIQGYIRSWSKYFRKHHIEEPFIDNSVLGNLESMKVVVDNLVHLERQEFAMVESKLVQAGELVQSGLETIVESIGIEEKQRNVEVISTTAAMKE